MDNDVKGPVEKNLLPVWPGIVIAVAVFLLQVVFGPKTSSKQATVMINGVYLCGWGYWLYSVFRLHFLLRKIEPAYPVSPAKAAWFHLIPFYNFYWVFAWTNRLVDFVNRRAGKLVMKKGWNGLLLLVGILAKSIDGPSSLLILFFTLNHLLNEAALALHWKPVQWEVERKKGQLVALDAALGAGFSLILVNAVSEFSAKGWGEIFAFLAVVGLVLVGVVRFFDPLMEQVRELLGLQEHARVQLTAEAKRHVIGGIGLGLTVLIGLIHGLLEKRVEENAAETFGVLIIMIVLVGLITYAWAVGTAQPRRKAALYGSLSGVFLGSCYLLLLWRLLGGNLPMQKSVREMVMVPVSLRELPVPAAINGLAWGLLGLAGGIGADKVKMARSSRMMALSLLACVVLGNFVWNLVLPYSLYNATNLITVIGWSLGLIVNKNSDALFGQRAPEPESSVVLCESANADLNLNERLQNDRVLPDDKARGLAESSAQALGEQICGICPVPPKGLAAVAGNGKLTLTWAASSYATSYDVKRSKTSGGPYATIGSATSNKYTDGELINGITYHYVVSAVNGSGESESSEQASATPQATGAPAKSQFVWKIVAPLASAAVVVLIWLVTVNRPLKVTSIQFYEAGPNSSGRGSYVSEFPVENTRGVYCEVLFSRTPSRDEVFQEVLHTPNGVNPPVPHNGGENPLTFFWGWDKPGNWLKGKYTVDINLGSRRLKSESFTTTVPELKSVSLFESTGGHVHTSHFTTHFPKDSTRYVDLDATFSRPVAVDTEIQVVWALPATVGGPNRQPGKETVNLKRGSDTIGAGWGAAERGAAGAWMKASTPSNSSSATRA